MFSNEVSWAGDRSTFLQSSIRRTGFGACTGASVGAAQQDQPFPRRLPDSSSGRHVSREIAFPQWVPNEVKALAEGMDEGAARAALGPWTSQPRRSHE